MLYAASLVLPTLFIGVLATRWVRHENARLRVMADAALEEQAAVMAGHLDLLVREIGDGLLETLSRLPSDEPEALSRLKVSHPLVRQVFLWRPDPTLLVPDPRWADTDEIAFMRRYDALFSGRRQWPAPPAIGETQAESLDSQSKRPAQRARYEAARQSAQVIKQTHATGLTDGHFGWLPWFWERDIHLLGWIRTPSSGQVRGIEMEIMAVQARFQPLFQQDAADASVAFALTDHNGERVMLTPAFEAWSADGAPTVAVPIGTLLPHWQILAVAAPSSGTMPFALFSALLVAILLVAILSGGGLLAWQGYRNQRDAARKTTFVSNVSHELKTPLTTIRMYAEMLRERRVRDAGKRDDYLGVIASESRRLTRLVNNVLDFSRLEQSRKTYRKERVDAVALLREVVSAHEDRFEEAGTRVLLTVPDQAVHILSDRDALEQTVLNLLDNAAKYAAAGGETNVDLKIGADAIRIVVADRGPGVPREHVQRIFNSFHRADDSLTTRVPGAGLGLSIARRLMRDLGGDVTYRPRSGGGSEFEIKIQKTGLEVGSAPPVEPVI